MLLSKFIEFWLFLTYVSCMFMSANISINVKSIKLSLQIAFPSFLNTLREETRK